MEKEDDTRRIKTTRDVIYLIKFIHKIEIDWLWRHITLIKEQFVLIRCCKTCLL
jgi:hypothetical protein